MRVVHQWLRGRSVDGDVFGHQGRITKDGQGNYHAECNPTGKWEPIRYWLPADAGEFARVIEQETERVEHLKKFYS